MTKISLLYYNTVNDIVVVDVIVDDVVNDDVTVNIVKDIVVV